MRSIAILSMLIVTASFANAQDAKSLYEEALKLKSEKKCSAAIDKFKKAIRLQPAYPDALYEMGWCQNDIKDYTGAIESLRKARILWPGTLRVFFELGYAFEKSGLKDSAVAAYNKALQIKPDYGSVHRQLGYIAYDASEHENALIHFAKYEAAETAKGSTIENYLYWYRKGYCQNALKQFENAKISLNRSLDQKKDNLNTYLELGFACSKLKQDEDAIGFYQKAMEVDPKSHIPYNGIGEVYRDNKKDYQGSMNWYNKSLAINSNERKANFGVGYCLNSLSKYTEAIAYLKKAIESEPTYTAAYVELGYSYYQARQDAQAESTLKKALELSNKNDNARYYLGLLYIAQKDKVKAQQMLDELKALSSKNAATLQEKINKMN